MYNYIKWIYWNIYFFFNRDLNNWADKLILTRYPYWKYKPFMFYNKEGRQWEINFNRNEDSELSYNKYVWIRVNAEVDQNDDIVGITIYDSALKANSDYRL